MHSLVIGLMIPEGELRFLVTACLYSLPVRVFSESIPPVNWSEFLERLSRLRPDALLVDAERWREALPELAATVKSLEAAPALFAVHSREDSALHSQLTAAGADDFLTPPFGERLAAVLERLSQERLQQLAGGRKLRKPLGVMAAKGGAGATTVACHLAVALRQVTEGAVLLADLDRQGGMVGFLMRTQTPYTFWDAARPGQRLSRHHWKALVSTHPSGVDVLPSDASSAFRQELELARLGSALRFASACYHWVVLDLGGVWNPEGRLLSDELDGLCLVATADAMGLYQTRRAIQELQRRGVDRGRLHLVLNRVGRDAPSVEELESLLGVRPRVQLPETGELEEAHRLGRPLSLENRVGRQCLRLARYLAGIPESRRSSKISTLTWRATARERIPPLVPRA